MLLVAAAAAAEEAHPPTVVERLFREAPAAEAWFAPAFLARIPAAQIDALVAELQAQHGPLQAVRQQGERLLVVLERAEVPTRLGLDGQGRIIGLFFEAPIPTEGDLAAQVAAIAALPGRTSLLVLSEGETLAALDAETPLAVGSAAKLAILEAVRRAVAEGRLAWAQVAPLEEGWRSLPTGLLQDWPAGTPLTLASLAALAISRSDNTATDGLLQLVGRAAVAAIAPRNRPFLSTRQLFQLKQRANAALLEAWAAADPEAREGLLAALEQAPAPRLGDLEPEPTLAAEWFFTARELCDLLEATAALPALRINPGPADPEAWAEVAYKGGSEAGVLNLSTRLLGRDGRAHCVVATWNDGAALDEARLVTPYRAILRGLRGE